MQKIRHQVEKYIDQYATDETQAKAMRLAVVGTGILWFILLILLAISPGFHKKKYKTVRITLAPVVEQKSDKQVSSAAATSAPAPAAQEKAEKAVQKKQESSETPKAAPKTAEQPKAAAPKPAASKPAEAPKQTTPAPQKAAIKYKKSVEELMAEQSTSSSKKSVDWDNMNFTENSSSSSTSSSSSSSSAKSIDNGAALSGTAGTATSANKAVTSQSAKSSAGTTASSSTASALSNISSTSYSMSAANGLKSTASVGVSTNSDGKLALAMTDGSARVLLDPSKPYIEISDENAKLIDSTRNVVITFRILAEGNVPLAGITITPSSALPMAIQSEIKEQISKWRFARALNDGQARFDYSIIKR